jgi:hypothetical protein
VSVPWNSPAPHQTHSVPITRGSKCEVPVDEHDDDLTSEVTEDAEEETDSFPVTADELEDEREGEAAQPGINEDESEL